MDGFHHIIPGVEDAAGALLHEAPRLHAVALRHHLGLARAEGDGGHGGGQGDVDGRGIAVFPGQHVHQPWVERGVFQTQVLRADLLAALHGGNALLREAAVVQRQLHLFVGGERYLQQRLVVLLVIAHREGDLGAVRPHVGDGIAGVDAEGHGLLSPGGILELIGRAAGDRARRCVREHLRAAAGAYQPLGVGNFIEGHHCEVRVAAVDEGLEGPGRAGTDQQRKGHGRAAGAPGASGEGAQRPLAGLADAEPGQRPHAGERRQPGKAHPGYRAKDAEVGKIVRQRPDTGVEPAQLPVARPYRQAQGGEGGKEHQRKVCPAGELIGGGGGQYAQWQGRTHQQKIGQGVVCAIEDRADEPPADGQPDEHGERRRHHCHRKQGQQAGQGCRQRGDHRVGEDVHPVSGRSIPFVDRKYAKEDAAHRAAGNGGVCEVHGEHGTRRSRLIEEQAHCRGEDGQGHDQPDKAALERS